MTTSEVPITTSEAPLEVTTEVKCTKSKVNMKTCETPLEATTEKAHHYIGRCSGGLIESVDDST